MNSVSVAVTISQHIYINRRFDTAKKFILEKMVNNEALLTL